MEIAIAPNRIND